MTQVLFKSRRIKPETIAPKETPAMTTPTTTPIKDTAPALYARHNAHFSKAKKFTYNYYPIDEIIVKKYATCTKKELTNLLREYKGRINYRVKVLQTLGLLQKKRIVPTKVERMLKSLEDTRRYHVKQANLAKKQLKAMEA